MADLLNRIRACQEKLIDVDSRKQAVEWMAEADTLLDAFRQRLIEATQAASETRQPEPHAPTAASQEKPRPEPVAWPSSMKVADVGFRWDGVALSHVPTILISFEPVPANSPNTAKGWAERDAMVAMLAGAEPVARQPLSLAQIQKAFDEAKLPEFGSDELDIEIARAIERAHGIPATPTPKE